MTIISDMDSKDADSDMLAEYLREARLMPYKWLRENAEIIG